MVSQLSLRILGGYNSSSSGASNASDSGKNNAVMSSVGGYSADKEEVASQPPCKISLRINHKRKPFDADDECAKRRRMNELHYAASTVREDLARANKPYPEVRTTRPRAIAFTNLDMSRVHLISSKDVTSPFLTPAAMGWNSTLTYDLLTNFGSAYNDVLQSCASAYYTPEGTSRFSSDDSESASSVSDTASDDSQGCPMLVVSSRLDDALDEKAKKLVETEAEKPSSQIISFPPTMAMAMEEALGVCDYARIITTASAPFTVVHSNAAYGVMADLSSTSIHGKSVSSLITSTDNPTSPMSLAKCAASSSAGRDVTAFVIHQTQNDSNVKCTMKVTPIVPSTNPRDVVPGGLDAIGDVREVSKVTHFCIDLITCTIEDERSDETRRLLGDEAYHQPAFSVVG